MSGCLLCVEVVSYFQEMFFESLFRNIGICMIMEFEVDAGHVFDIRECFRNIVTDDYDGAIFIQVGSIWYICSWNLLSM